MSCSGGRAPPIREKRRKSRKPRKATKKSRRETVDTNSSMSSEVQDEILKKYACENLEETTDELLKKYKEMTRTELEELCERVLLFDNKGVYVPPGEFKLDCQLRKPKSGSEKPTEGTCKNIESAFGKGMIGHSCDTFGSEVCHCCNPVNRTHNLYPVVKLESDLSRVYKGMSNNEQGEALDLSRPSCSGIQAENIVPEASESNSATDIMDFVNSLNLQLNRQEIENCIGQSLDSTINVSDLSQLTSDFTSSLNDSVQIVSEQPPTAPAQENNSEVVDLTSLSDTTIPTAVIDLVDQEFKTNLIPGQVEVIDLIDSDSDTETKASNSSDDSRRKSSDNRPTLECPVCLESLKNKKIMSTNCGHIFCSRCIRNIAKKTKRCPNCRKKLTSNSVHPIYFNF